MLDIKFIREHPKKVQEAAKAKGVIINVEDLLKLDEQFQKLQREVQILREEKNATAKIKGKPTPEQIEKGKKIKEALDKKEEALQEVEVRLNEFLVSIPNPAKPDVKVGKDESENEVIK